MGECLLEYVYVVVYVFIVIFLAAILNSKAKRHCLGYLDVGLGAKWQFLKVYIYERKNIYFRIVFDCFSVVCILHRACCVGC